MKFRIFAGQLESVKLEYKDERPALEEEITQAKSEFLKIEASISLLKEQILELDGGIDRLKNKQALTIEQINHQVSEYQRIEQYQKDSTVFLQQLNQELTVEKEKIRQIKESIEMENICDSPLRMEICHLCVPNLQGVRFL